MDFVFQEDLPRPVVPGGAADIPPTRFVFEEDAPVAIENTIRNAVSTNPDENAKINRLTQESGRERATVASDPKSVEQDLQTQRITAIQADSPATHRFLSVSANAQVAHDSVEQLSAIERITNAFKRGAVGRELGLAGSQYRRDSSAATRRRIDDLQIQLRELGNPNPSGFVSFLEAASEVVGQMTSGLADPELAASVATGMVGGATIGAFGGPLAPATAAAGAGLGMAAGAASFFVRDSFEVEGGSAYVEMLREGIDPEVAKWLSAGVGVINAGLETASEAILAAPLVGAAKNALKGYVNKAVRSQAVVSAARQFATAYAGGIAAETATEATQEYVQILASEWGKQLTDANLEEMTEEEMVDRVSGVMVQTMKAMTILAAPGPGLRWATQKREIAQTEKDVQTVKDLQSAMEESPLTERDPTTAAAHVAEAMTEAGVQDAYISAEAFNEWISGFENPGAMAAALGVEDQYQESQTLGTDVRVSAAKFAEYILNHDAYDIIKDRIKFTPDGLTPLEAEELKTSGVEDLIVEEEEGGPSLGPDDPATDYAANELGLRALFKTGDEAGMSPEVYADYLRSIDAAQQETSRRQKESDLIKKTRLLSDEYRKKFQKIEAEEMESIGNLPVYQAVHGLQADRLDRDLVQSILGKEIKLDRLPEQSRGRKIYTEKGGQGIDPDAYAQLYGYESGHEMFMDMLTSPSFKEAVYTSAHERAKVELADIFNERQALLDARKALLNDKVIDFLTVELNALNGVLQGGTDKKGRPKNISTKLVRSAALSRLQQMKLQDISPDRFLRQQHRYAVAAGKALRDRQQGKGKARVAGDRSQAVQFKYQQIVNYAMAQQAAIAQERVTRQKAYLSKFVSKKRKSSLPLVDKEAILQLLSKVRFDNTVEYQKPRHLDEISKAEIDPKYVPNKYLDPQGRLNYRLMTLEDFSELVDTVKSIEKRGNDATRLRKKTEKRQADVVAAMMKDLIDRNLRTRDETPSYAQDKWDAVKDGSHQYAMLLFNQDTFVRELDGFEDLGFAYQYLKKPYDDAMSNGYQPGQVGFIRREKEISKKIKELFDVFTKSERINFNKKVSIAGVSKNLSRQEFLSVLLNSGNKDNVTALIESGQFTQGEIDAIHQHASKKEWDFVQGVWDYFDSFWNEIVDTKIRRDNVRPSKVIATPITTSHGTYSGGYYPLSYDNKGSLTLEEKDATEMITKYRQGYYVSSHTRDGHTKGRVGGQKKPVSLSLGLINSHLRNVIYDLEVGDAVNDIFKVLHQKDVIKAFSDKGQSAKWQGMNLWLRDVVLGEVGSTNVVEKSFRWLRNGYTISALGWNVSNAMLQLLGLTQTSVVVGKRNTAAAVLSVLSHPSIFKRVSELSPFMQARESTWHKDIADAQRVLTTTILDKWTPGKTADFLRESTFFMVKKTQRVTDVITWVAGQRKGLQLFNGDVKKAIEYADRMVVRSQSSGIFGDRTALERGSLTTTLRQTELIRAFTPLISFFMTKTNIAIEQTKKTDWKNPISVMSWATDMVILYISDALILAYINSDEDDEEGVFSKASGAAIGTVMSGFPLIRDISSTIQGFPSGGMWGNIGHSFGNVYNQVSQGELDAAFVKSVNKILGIMLHYPAGQINKTIGGAEQMQEDEDTSAIRLIMGPKF